jgi:hypothetical protein
MQKLIALTRERKKYVVLFAAAIAVVTVLFGGSSGARIESV